MTDLSDAVVIVTGGSGAIGAATAREFARQGASLVVTSHSRSEDGERVAREARDLGASTLHVSADLRNRAEADRIVATAVQEFGRVDVLVNLAGSTVGGGNFEDLTEDDWLSAFSANLFSSVWTSQAVVPEMRRVGGGAIINTSSVRGLEHCGRTSIMAYSAAKAALINFTKTLAKEVAPQIAVNAVAPGFVYTPNYESMAPELTQAFIDATLIGRFIDVDELAKSIVFIAQSPAITGQVVTVDGGFSLKFQ